jgi:hypothetical protein
MTTDQFEPKLGGLRAPPAKRESHYLATLLRSASRSGASLTRKGQRPDWGRIAGGAGFGRLLGCRDHPAGLAAGRANRCCGVMRTVGEALAGLCRSAGFSGERGRKAQAAVKSGNAESQKMVTVEAAQGFISRDVTELSL